MFSQLDVVALRTDKSSAKRSEIAAKIGQEIDSEQLTAEQMREAEGIVRALAKDIEVEVRAALASAVRHSTRLPHSVAVSLANDVDAVALPILATSVVLTDDDLVELVRRGSAAGQRAIANRANVAEPVSAALVDHADEAAVTVLMRNATSRISEDSYNAALERFPESEPVKHSMARRPTLPVGVAERLVTLVSDEFQHYLMTHHNLPRALAAELATRSRECAVLGVSRGQGVEQVESLVAQVAARGRLTPTLLLRALCTGDMPFFEAGMARLASVPTANARILIHDPGTKSFASLYRSSGLPAKLLPAFRAAIDVIDQKDCEYDHNALGDMRACIINRLQIIFEGAGEEEFHYLMDRIREVTTPA